MVTNIVPPESRMKLSIVIPCYNEAKTIRTIVDRVRAAPVAEKEIIIVDDCSRDGTRDLLRTQIAPLVDRIIYHEVNQGKGAALRTGFAAACNYVVAESFRRRAQGMTFPSGVDAQKQVLVRRAELLLEAQREYFNTISLNNLDNYHWAAASGYHIGNMYDELWRSIMSAPVPAHLPAEGHGVYHQELAKLIKPLIRHAIRYWELTLMFIERTGIKTTWAEQTKVDLARVRALMLEQPPGPGGLPPTEP
jgi:glycosyltransferase involved in cell wall biosynthesis